MIWTCRQEEILRELCYKGAAAVRDAIEKECGVRHSVRAVEMHASRIKVSLRVRSECPECRAVGVKLNRQSGLCPRCTEEQHVAEEKAFNELLLLEAQGCEEGPEIEAARKEYARLRQANSRLMRKYGLKGKRERE